MKKRIYGFLLLAVILTNLYLTLQPPASTVKLSETVRLWLEQFGYHTDYHSIRSNAHIIVFFIIGIILYLYGRASGWKWWVILLAGFSLGLLDEGIKIWLSTREFDFVDLVKDWVGMAVAMVVIWLTKAIKPE